MNKYYFTFGQNHVQKDGTVMKDYYISVIAEDSYNARDRFCEWTKKYMPSVSTWGLQYEEKTFDSSFFPKGLYTELFETKHLKEVYKQISDISQSLDRLNDKVQSIDDLLDIFGNS